MHRESTFIYKAIKMYVTKVLSTTNSNLKSSYKYYLIIFREKSDIFVVYSIS